MEYWKHKAFNSIDYHQKRKASVRANKIKGQCKSCWDYNETKAVYYLAFLKNSHWKYTKINHDDHVIKVKPYDMIPYIDYYPIDDEEPKHDAFTKQQAIITKTHYDSNKWGNQQKRNKIETKRAFGRYYRMKKNKTWKWKLKKRRRSKRRNLNRWDTDDYDETFYCKMTQIIIKHNSNTSMASYSHISSSIGNLDNYYRIIIECDSCYSLIYIHNKHEFMTNKDSNGHNIYHYYIDSDKITAKNKHYFNFIYGKYRRIFCNDCLNDKIIECCFINCRVKEISRNLCKTIEIKDEKNDFYGRYFVCNNHKKCEICNKGYSYNDNWYWRLNEYKVNKCRICDKYICNNCKLHGMCILCIDNNQFNVLYKILCNTLDITAINIIKNYCNGYFIVTCCALNDCTNSIYIKDILSLTRNNKLYSYISKDYATSKAVNIFGQQLIIFCRNCTATKLIECIFSNCNHKEASSNVCQIHPFCNICNYKFDGSEYDEKYYKRKCVKCNHCICCYCMIDGICKICIEITEFDKIRNALDCNIGKILNMSLINIIAYHCTAYFNVKCCNLYDCNNYIDIKNVESLFRFVDEEERNIYCYEANIYSLENSVYLYGYQLIIFCVKCTKKKLKKCKYHQFTLQRGFGNDIYDKSKCYNLEGSHIICQNHPNHHKTKCKANIDTIIRKQKELKRIQRKQDKTRPFQCSYSGYRYRNICSSPKPTPISVNEYMKLRQKYQICRNRQNDCFFVPPLPFLSIL